MYMKYKTFSNTKGSITIEALIAISTIITIFTCFIFIITYIKINEKLKSDLNTKAYDIAIANYKYKIAIPSVIKLYDKREIDQMNMEYFFCYSETFGDEITIYLDCVFNGYIKKVKINLHQTIHKWKGDGLSYSEQNVWAMPNIKRGLEIEDIYGGNLPKYFPTIDGYNEFTGEIVLITSIDTTAQTYIKYDKFFKQIKESVLKLEQFNGVKYGDIKISKLDIDRKKLIIVLPKNPLNRIQIKVINDIKEYCLIHNINLNIKRYQQSYVNISH